MRKVKQSTLTQIRALIERDIEESNAQKKPGVEMPY
jgi:hypothetical protein